MARYLIFLCLLFGTTTTYAANADIRHDLIRQEYTIHPDLSYSLIETRKTTLLTPAGLSEGQQDSLTYYPGGDTVTLLEAYVVKPNGQKIPVTPQNIYREAVTEGENTPGFAKQMRHTVVFPLQEPGSQTVIKRHVVYQTVPELGINLLSDVGFYNVVERQEITIKAPTTLKIHWGKQGDFQVKETDEGKFHIIKAVLTNQPAHKREAHMVSVKDVAPLFIASTLNNWSDIGNAYWHHAKDKTRVTPKIAQLAQQIVGDKKDYDAAKALHDWVAANIRYVMIPFNASSGFIPHSAESVVQNGFGDCKDHVALLQALLHARGIASEPVLVAWDNSFTQLPLWHPAQFNHVMIYLPKWNLYANPTSATTPFGKLETYLANKFVLHATKQSHTERTPVNTAQTNQYFIDNQITIDSNGAINGEGKIAMHGNVANMFRAGLKSNDTERENMVNDLLSVTNEGGYGNLKLCSKDILDNEINVSTKWYSPQAYSMGQTIYLTTPTGVDFRDTHYLFSIINAEKIAYPMTLGAQQLNWQTAITLPPGYKVTQLPEQQEVKNGAGHFIAEYARQQDKVIIKRQLVFNKDVYQPQDYADLKQLIYRTLQDGRNVIVLRR